MNKATVEQEDKVEGIFAAYPDHVKAQMNRLRVLVRETAKATEGVTELTETLKWGEPSFLTKHGSTVRMDWKSKTPNQYAIYFKCTSRLVETFKLVFGSTFQYEGKRAIVFQLGQDIPELELKQCIRAALRYHKVKDLDTLGI